MAKKPAKKKASKPTKTESSAKPKKISKIKKPTKRVEMLGVCGCEYHNPRDEKIPLYLCNYCRLYFCRNHSKALVPEVTEEGQILSTEEGHPCFAYLERRKFELKKQIDKDEEELGDLMRGHRARMIKKERDKPKDYESDFYGVPASKHHRRIAIILVILFIAMAIGLVLYAMGYWPILFPQLFA